MGLPSFTAPLTLAALLVVGQPALAQAQTGPDLRAYTTSRFLPYASGGEAQTPFTDPAKLSFRLQRPGGGASRHFTTVMDTGSTGVVISAADLPGYSATEAANHPQGWEFLSSSKLLWVGHWLPRELIFLDGSGQPLATATVPVLAVEIQYTCPGWSEKANQPTCANPQQTVTMPPDIAYMGVGFGREHDGQPQGTPDKNPLLNLTAIDGQPVAAGSFRPGYIITPTGVQVGLTLGNSQNMAWTQLHGRSLNAAGKPASDDPRDWPQASMAVTVNDLPAQSGPVLIDTGIAQMYLSVPDPTQLPTQPVPNPSRHGSMSTGLSSGSRVAISFPDATAPVAQYRFTAGDPSDQNAPSVVLVPAATPTAFVNTGRHLLRGYDVAFDAEGGWFGLRAVTP